MRIRNPKLQRPSVHPVDERERERELRGAILSGTPPLGPGAPSRERAIAFFDAYVGYLAGHLELIRLSETASPGARYRIGAYRFWHRHLAILLEGTADPDHLAHVLLAVVDADLNSALRDQGYDWDRIRAGVCDLVARALGSVHRLVRPRNAKGRAF